MRKRHRVGKTSASLHSSRTSYIVIIMAEQQANFLLLEEQGNTNKDINKTIYVFIRHNMLNNEDRRVF